jgi:hypothetical protein
MTVLVAATGMMADSQRTSVRETTELRAEIKKLNGDLSDLREKHATARAELHAERGSGALRLLVGNLGAVLLGLILFAYEKGKVAGLLACAIIGGLMVAGAWFHAWMFQPSTSSDGGKK